MDNEAVVRVGSKAISRVVCLTSKEHKIKEITGRVSGGKEKVLVLVPTPRLLPPPHQTVVTTCRAENAITLIFTLSMNND